VLEADKSAGTLEDQLREGFLGGLSFDDDTLDRVKIFTQKSEDAVWERFGGLEFTPQAALPLMVNLWNQGLGLKVEVTQVLTGDWDAD
jgi:hypothetical protein